MRKNLVIAFVLSMIIVPAIAQDPPLWMRYPSISPDGETIVFSYRGDLYRVPASGGLAYPITLHDAHDFRPVWSNDGTLIAFASFRHGNYDVYVIPAAGGRARRLTFHSAGDFPTAFTPDDRSVIFSSSRLDSAENQQFPSGTLSELYSIPVEGGQPRQILTVPAEEAQFDRSGTRLIYQDVKGYEDYFRKHHKSAVTRDIWMYESGTDRYRQITDFPGEDRNPVFSADQQSVFYLSEVNGDFNIFRVSLADTSDRTQLTRFRRHPVRNLTSSDDDFLCFTWNGEIYTLRPGEQARKVPIRILTDLRYNEGRTIPIQDGITEIAVSPNGKELAFVVRGEVFAASVAEGTTRRITNTPEQERSVSFSPDGRSILYAGERDGSWNIYRSKLVREEEQYFFISTVQEEEAIIASDAEEFQPAFSPNGKEVAYLEERTTLKVINLETRQIREILPGDMNYSYSDGDQHYQWSPDGKWFLASFLPPRNWTKEAGLIAADGSGEVINLTKSGYTDSRPQWKMKGRMMMWFSNRDGMKNHASWGGEQDVYGMFFTQEAWDRFNLSKEEFELLKEQEKKKEKEKKGESEEPEKEESTDEEESSEDEKTEELKIELDGIEYRKARLTIHSSRLADAHVSAQGDKLFYLARFEKGYNLWQTDLRTKETKILADLGSSQGGSIIPDKEEKNLFILAGGNIQKIEIKTGKKSRIKISGEMVLDRAREREYLFEHAWRQVVKKFYRTDLHGVDWGFYKTAYTRFLPHINNNHDFAEMLSEMLGELNGSHTGTRYRPRNESGDQTASLGLFYDETWEGDGLKIAEVMARGPAVKEGSKIRAGILIEKIDGTAITPAVNPNRLLNRKAGKNTLLSLFDPQSDERWEEVIKPISRSEENELRYRRWVENCRRIVDELSDGRIGYVHVRGMNDRSYRAVYEEVLGRHHGKEALVVDTRFNGGGWLHDDLATFLSGKRYISFRPRGLDIGGEPQFKWQKPSIVVMSESNYSDAHMFPFAYRALKIGKLLGMPVPGTGTAVWWERLQDRSLVFGIPQVGMVSNSGEYLENTQLEPDIRVPLDPGVVSRGRDQQLERAVEELLAGLPE